jgi:hypothetical protein
MNCYFREKNRTKCLFEHLRHRTSGPVWFQNKKNVPAQIGRFILDVISLCSIAHRMRLKVIPRFLRSLPKRARFLQED